MAMKRISRSCEPRRKTLPLSILCDGPVKAKPVLITVSSLTDENERVSLTTRGMLASMPSGWGLCFYEAEINSRTNHFIYLVCDENAVTISRIGDSASVIVHRAGGTYINCQTTSEGTQTTHIFTHYVRIRRRGRTGQIHLSYQMNGPDAPYRQANTFSRYLDIRFRPCK